MLANYNYAGHVWGPWQAIHVGGLTQTSTGENFSNLCVLSLTFLMDNSAGYCFLTP